jgi:predicted ATPase/DNA-binding SARP family transcriptional activator
LAFALPFDWQWWLCNYKNSSTIARSLSKKAFAMLQVNFFGGATITLNGEEVALTGRPLALFAYLLLNPKTHRRLALARLFHEDSKDPQAQFRWTLNKLKKRIGAQFFLIKRQTVSFKFESKYLLDIDKLNEGDVTVYRGELLPDLHLNNALDFMNWLIFQREAHRRQAESLLVEQLDAALQGANWQQVMAAAHHLLRLDNLREEWLLPLMQAYVQVGNPEQALTLYESYAKMLADELSLTPGPELQQLASQLRTMKHADAAFRNEVPKTYEPDYFQNPAIQSDHDFIGREKSIERLLTALQETIDKKEGQVFFIKGSIGSGKSKFIHEIIRQVTNQHKECLVTYGRGSAIESAVAAYQPFIDLFSLLTARNLEKALLERIIPLAQARRLWQASSTIQTIIHSYGPLLAKYWFLDQENTNDSISNHESQQYLFQQVTATLTTLAARFPLIICLDDLQWADKSSISLLFHLGQRLTGSRIFMICAYREAPFQSLESNRAQRLSQTIIELQRRNGSAPINLDTLDHQENLSFVNSLLDIEPNQYTEQFRDAFFAQTNGHPLFAIELLNALKSDGILFQSKEGKWKNQIDISWKRLPARVEAVIEKRVSQLSEELQQVLSIAAVEGQYFTVQLISQIAGYSIRELLNLLTPLLNQHPPFIEHANRQENSELLQIKFSQKLFQQFFYQRINATELILLHGEIAETLENLFSSSTESIAARLAYHFEKANLTMRAVTYYKIAAETAVAQFANEAAISHFTKALDLVPANEPGLQTDLFLARESLYDLMGNRKGQADDLRQIQLLANKRQQTALPSIYLTRQAKFAFNQSKFNQALHLSQEVLKRQNTPLEILLSAHQLIGQIYLNRGEIKEAKNHFDQALQLAEEISSLGSEATIFRSFGLMSAIQGEITIARTYLEKARIINQYTHSLIGEAKVLQNICSLEHRKGEFPAALRLGQQALSLFQKVGFRQGEGRMLQNIGSIYLSMGQHRQAFIYQQQARQHFRILGDRTGEAVSLVHLAKINFQKQNYQEALVFAERATSQLDKLNLKWHRCLVLILKIRIFLQQENWRDAGQMIEEASLIWSSFDISTIHPEIQASKVNLALLQGDTQSAVTEMLHVKERLTPRLLDWSADPFFLYLVCYKVLKEAEPTEAENLLGTAHQLLQTAANNLGNQSDRKQYLENIPSNREIITAYN